MNTRAKRWSVVLGCVCALVGVSWLIAAEPGAPAKFKKTKDQAEVTVRSKSAVMIELERGDAALALAPSKRCDDNSDCRDRDYCALPDGECDGRGTCQRRPQGCPDVWDPVCGCDGVTYGNKCDAAAAGVNVAHAGECEPKCCDPALEPGQNGIPFCFEGASCCVDGNWACNDADGSPTCPLGEVCVEICGGFAGIACSDPDDFCKTSPGECCCDFFGVCTDVPEFCPEIYAPVCGCDGQTYDNECFADAAGVSVDFAGPCGGGGEVCGGIQGIACENPNEFCKTAPGECCCDFQGVCTPIPNACPLNYDPVCGCDGVTYGNACLADAAGVSVDHAGACGDGCQSNADCAVLGQLFGEFCQKATGDCNGTGQCAQVPQLCLDVWIPVCGCDGNTYSNSCYAHRVGVNVASEGACGSDQ